MKWREIIERVDRSDKNKSHINQEKFLRALNLDIWIGDYDALENAGFMAYYLAPWYCTDTWVGFEIIFYKDKPVCVSFQSARKNDVEYEFVGGKATLDEIFPIVAALVRPSDDEVAALDLDEEMGAGIKRHYNQEILDEEVILDATGERVSIIRRKRGGYSSEEIKSWSTVDIMKNGVKVTLPMKEITIPWRVT